MNDLEPSEFYLSQNYPNPFSEKTTIKFCVAYKINVKLEVFNSEGELIKILLDKEKEAGTYEVEIKSSVCHLSEGIYLYRLQAADYSCEKEFTFLKKIVVEDL